MHDKVVNKSDFYTLNLMAKTIKTTKREVAAAGGKTREKAKKTAGKVKDSAAKSVNNRPALSGKPLKAAPHIDQNGLPGAEAHENGFAQNGKVAAASETIFVKTAPPKAFKIGGRKKPVILVTNDDGISAPGIRALVEAVKGLGKVVVVAPDRPQSGMGHAITIGNPLRLQPMHHLFEGVDAWQCSGTPVDCVKLAVDKVLHRKPDLCLSGINHGSNHSINVIYSGTMSAAVEAAIESIPSIGFSILDYSVDADFTAARKYVKTIVEQILAHPMDKHLILNVNFPAVPENLIKGIKVCRQAYAKYEEDFVERNDPNGKKYYWLTGKFVNFDKGRDTDVWALEHNYVSVVPVQFDMTNYVLKSKLEKTWKS